MTPRILAEDSLIFGLRMNEGVALTALRARFRRRRGRRSTPWRNA